jgi:hypothetical protein
MITSAPEKFLDLNLLSYHLQILAAFEGFLSSAPTEEQARLYLINAECRYELYLDMLSKFYTDSLAVDGKLYSEGALSPLPPFDVAMVYHAHLLSASSFREDIMHNYPILYEIGLEFPLERISSAFGNPLVSKGSAECWNLQYPESPYDLQAPFDQTQTVFYTCPYCDHRTKASLAMVGAMLTEKKTEQGFPCWNCKVWQNADTISAQRFLLEMKSLCQTPGHVLLGFHFENKNQKLSSESLILLVRNFFTFERNFSIHYTELGALARNCSLAGTSCSWKEIELALGLSFQSLRKEQMIKHTSPKGLRKCISSFQGLIHPFSMSLPEAVIRQRSFSSKILSTSVGSSLGLTMALDRFEKWFKLLQKNEIMIVPTLDIDLAWHTLLLSPKKYDAYCQTVAGRFINHDDTVEQKSLNRQLFKTARLWFETYNQPYMIDDGSIQKEFWTTGRLVTSMFLPPLGLVNLVEEKNAKKYFWKESPNEKDNSLQKRRHSLDMSTDTLKSKGHSALKSTYLWGPGFKNYMPGCFKYAAPSRCGSITPGNIVCMAVLDAWCPLPETSSGGYVCGTSGGSACGTSAPTYGGTSGPTCGGTSGPTCGVTSGPTCGSSSGSACGASTSSFFDSSGGVSSCGSSGGGCGSSCGGGGGD